MVFFRQRRVLAEFGLRESPARVAYKRFVEAGMKQPPQSPWRDVVDGWMLGRAEFVEQMRSLEDDSEIMAMSNSSLTVAAVLPLVAETFGVSVESIRHRGGQRNLAREAAVWLLREAAQAPVSEIAELLGGVGKSTISETYRRAVQRRNQDESFRRLLEAIWKS